MTTYKIAIIGAGPAGCTLAHLLSKADMDVTVFEGEASSDARSQGGTLDLHNDTGIAVLKECGLYAKYEKYVRYDGEANAIADKNNKRYINLSGSSNSKNSRGRPEIDRSKLRDVLASPLSEKGIIRWGHYLKSVDANGTLQFTSGTASGFDLIVGADGAWSKVRKVLTDEIPAYAGISGLDARIPNAAEERPWIDKLTRKGTWMGFGDCRSITCQQLGDGTINAYFWGLSPEDRVKGYDLSNPAAIRERLHREYRDWVAEYHAVIDAVNPDSFIPRIFYQLPIGMSWESKPGFTIIGDAAHLMSPFSGEGVNCALVDASELAGSIVEAAAAGAIGREGLAPYVAAFEKKMLKRMTPLQQSTLLNLEDMYLNPASPRATIEKFIIRNIVEHTGWYFRIPVSIITYTYFFYVKWRLG
jgi:2-polyprenyl-6-methoxyphenol hydroxylase-like FAD-dependent oxidoreductase